MVSGSAALPEPIMKTWQEITGWDQVIKVALYSVNPYYNSTLR